MIIGYGFQESEQEEKRKRFFLDIEKQIKQCINASIPFLWIGDSNGKIGKRISANSDIITSNGKLILEISQIALVLEKLVLAIGKLILVLEKLNVPGN